MPFVCPRYLSSNYWKTSVILRGNEMVDRAPLLGTRYQIRHYLWAEVRKRGRIFCFPTSLIVNLLVIHQTLGSGVDFHDNVINITCLGRASCNRKTNEIVFVIWPQRMCFFNPISPFFCCSIHFVYFFDRYLKNAAPICSGKIIASVYLCERRKNEAPNWYKKCSHVLALYLAIETEAHGGKQPSRTLLC